MYVCIYVCSYVCFTLVMMVSLLTYYSLMITFQLSAVSVVSGQIFCKLATYVCMYVHNMHYVCMYIIHDVCACVPLQNFR